MAAYLIDISSLGCGCMEPLGWHRLRMGLSLLSAMRNDKEGLKILIGKVRKITRKEERSDSCMLEANVNGRNHINREDTWKESLKSFQHSCRDSIRMNTTYGEMMPARAGSINRHEKICSPDYIPKLIREIHLTPSRYAIWCWNQAGGIKDFKIWSNGFKWSDVPALIWDGPEKACWTDLVLRLALYGRSRRWQYILLV